MKLPSKVLWPGMIFILIGANLCIVTATVIAANAGRSFAFSEPNYYEAAVNWNSTALERAESERAGWSIRTTISESAAEIAINDRDGRPIANAPANIECFSLLTPSQRRHFTVTTDAHGIARIPGPFKLDPHEFRLRITTANLTFIRTLRTGE